MEPLTAVAVSAVVFVIFTLLTLLNFARTTKGMFDFDQPMEDSFKSFGSGMGLHAIFGGLASLAFLALVGSGIWLLVVSLG